jgi:fermentation-respiration switch protein FrsA (DUF1100 family)
MNTSFYTLYCKKYNAYKRAAEPKKLYVVPNAGHVDLYDKTNLIPFDKLESFLKKYVSVNIALML